MPKSKHRKTQKTKVAHTRKLANDQRNKQINYFEKLIKASKTEANRLAFQDVLDDVNVSKNDAEI